MRAGELIGPYVLERVLGHGQATVTWLARHPAWGAPLVVQLLDSGDPARGPYLRNAARASAAVHGDNCVQVREVQETRRGPALVMDLIDGPTMAEWVRDSAPKLPVALDAFRGVLSAVEGCHRAGWIHRDLKPANVLMDLSGKRVAAYLTGFELARARSDPPEPPGPVGTPGYVAPEQWVQGDHADERSDIFGLGCILYTLVAGRPPFRGVDSEAQQEAIRTGDFVPAARCAVALAPELSLLLGSMLDPVARRRPQSVADVRAALGTVPLSRAGPPPPAPAFGRWAPSSLPVVTTPVPARARSVLRGEDWMFLVVPMLVLMAGWMVRLAIG